jgi:hypothetical protein
MASTACTSSRGQRCPHQLDLHQILYFLVILKLLDLHFSMVDTNPTRLLKELLCVLPDVHERSHTATGRELLVKPALEIENEMQVVRAPWIAPSTSPPPSSSQCSGLAFAIPFPLMLRAETLRQGSRICRRQGSRRYLAGSTARLRTLKIGTWIGHSLAGSQKQKARISPLHRINQNP